MSRSRDEQKTMRVRPVVILGGLALVGVIAPALVSGTDHVDATCRAFYGSRNDGICLDGPPGPPTQAPMGPVIPGFGVGPTDNGTGVSTGPLFPGQTIDTPAG
jgi:hypothetical protein